MIGAIVRLLCCACLGEAIVSTAGLPVPGPIVGMTILALSQIATESGNREVERVFDLVAPHIPLFFVPSAVGFVARLDLLASQWMAISAAVLIGTVVAIAAAGLVFQAVLSLRVKESLA